MGNLSKLKIAVGQPELLQGAPSRNDMVQDRMIALAVEGGADVLMLPGSLTEASEVHIIALNDARIDIAGSNVVVEVAGETYQIGLGPQRIGCDFAVYADTTPWSLDKESLDAVPGIVLRPVGMSNVDKKVFAYDGGTSVYSPNGHLLARLRDDFEEDFTIVTLGEDGVRAKPCEDKLLAALVKTIRRFDQQVLQWEPKWVIGLSGGLDSSIVAALLVLALGPERVVGYGLSSEFNSEATKANASQLAEALGIEFKPGAVGGLVDATRLAVSSFGYPDDAVSGLVLENVQARVRGHLLSTFAAIENGVVACNGNRVEGAFGYATLYGDAIGALAPIGNLTKTKLFSLAHAINGRPGVEVIPENLLPRETDDGYEWDTMPSAELSDGQKDPMKWFYHDWLVEQLLDAPSVDTGACSVLQGYLDDKLLESAVGKWVPFYGLDDPQAFIDDFDWVMASLRKSAFKRIQSPPIITLASHAALSASPEVQGEIEPSDRFKELRARILKTRFESK